MQTIQISDMEKDFDGMLDRVEGGETFIITRQGRAVARMSPDTRLNGIDEAEIDQRRVDEAMASIQEIKGRTNPVSLDELLATRDEGRR